VRRAASAARLGKFSRRVVVALACVVACFSSSRANAQSFKVSGNPGTLAIQGTPVAGTAPTSVSDATTTYTLTSAQNGGKMTAQLNAAMPTGLTLTIAVDPPPGASSSGPVALSTTPQNVATGIVSFTGNATRNITYTLTATAAAGIVPLQSRTVTLTITSAP